MALATQCPHCHTTFRVASDQLKLRGGIVRCGACQRIFDGSAHLIDLEALAARKALDAAAAPPPEAGAFPVAEPPVAEAPAVEPPVAEPAAVEPPVAAPPVAEPPVAEPPVGAPPVAASPIGEPPAAEAGPAALDPADAAGDADTEPVYTLDFDHTFDPFGILPKVEPTLDAAPPADDTAGIGDAAGAAAHDLPPVSGARAVAGTPIDPDIAEPGADSRIEPGFGAPQDEDEDEDEDEAENEAQDRYDDEDAHAQPHEAGLAAAEAFAAVEADAAPEPEPEPAHVPAYAYAPAGRIEPGFGLPVDEELVAQPLPGHEPESEPEQPAGTAHVPDAAAPPRPTTPAPPAQGDIPPAALPLRASADAGPLLHPARGDTPSPAPRSARAKALEARARRSKMTPTRIEAPKLRMPAEPDEPEFVKRSRRQEQSGRLMRILMTAGAAVLLLALAFQLLLNFRNELAVRYPAARPLLSGVCVLAGCRVGLPARAENLVIDDGELATLAPGTYALNTQLRNQGNLALAWPSIELELTDANNKPVLRRVFGPADYLPPGAQAAAGFGAHAEQPVRLNFALTDLKPSGYHTFVFYP